MSIQSLSLNGELTKLKELISQGNSINSKDNVKIIFILIRMEIMRYIVHVKVIKLML